MKCYVYLFTGTKSWKKVWAAKGTQARWEIPLTDFHDAGGKHPGMSARFIKLAPP